MTADSIKKAKDSSTFCILPFSHMATKTDGAVKLCCRSWPVGHVGETSLREIWNSDLYRRVRMQLLNNERPPECDACWRLEDIDVTSMRQRFNRYRTQYLELLNEMDEDGNMPFKVPVLEAKLSNLCNLKCRMCHPVDSTQWAKDWNHIEHLMKENNESTFNLVRKLELTKKPYVSGWDDNDAFWAEFDELAPHFDRVEFAGGEPLIDPIHYRILHRLLPYANRITLKYATNMTSLNYRKDDVLALWNNFKDVHVNVSIDGTGEVYDYIRQLGSYSEVKANIEAVRRHPKVRTLIGACTFQVYNIFTLPEIMTEFVDVGLQVHSHRVAYPRFLDMRIIPEAVKEPLAKKISDFIDSIPARGWTPEVQKNVTTHARDNLNYLISKDMTSLLPEFMEFSDKLDVAQNVKLPWTSIIPDLARALGR